jgi:hypothetical protein
MKKCIKCNSEHNGTFGSGKYCSRSCANSRTFSEESKKKKSLANKGQVPINKMERANFICKHCGTQFEDRINSTKKYCSKLCVSIAVGRLGGMKSKQGRRSKNETLFADNCIEYFDKVLTNEPMFNGWDADVIIEDIKVAVLWNGKWHYKKITEKHSVKQVQNRDKIKLDEIKKSGYIPYVIKDMGKFNEEKVQKEFDKFIKYINVL